MADNDKQFVRIGSREFIGTEKLNEFLENYTEANNELGFIPYLGEKIIVLPDENGTNPSIGYYYIGDGKTPLRELTPSISLSGSSTNAATAGPDYIEGMSVLKETIATLSGRVALLEEQMANAQTTVADAVLKSKIPAGLVLSFTQNVNETDIIKAFGGNVWNNVEGYLKGIDINDENEKDNLGYVSGSQYVDITNIPAHTHTGTVKIGEQIATLELDESGANGEEITSTLYSPNTFYLNSFTRDIAIEYPEDPTPPSSTDPEPSIPIEEEPKIIIYSSYIGNSATNGRWLGSIKDFNRKDSVSGYSGIFNNPITGFRIGQQENKTISLTFKTKLKGAKNWGEEITFGADTASTDNESIVEEDGTQTVWSNYSGNLQTPISCFMIKSNDPRYKTVYQGHDKTRGWLNIIEKYDISDQKFGYSGFDNYELDAIAIKLVPIPQEAQTTIELENSPETIESTVKTVTIENVPYNGAKINDKYVELNISSQETPLYIPLILPNSTESENE